MALSFIQQVLGKEGPSQPSAKPITRVRSTVAQPVVVPPATPVLLGETDCKSCKNPLPWSVYTPNPIWKNTNPGPDGRGYDIYCPDCRHKMLQQGLDAAKADNLPKHQKRCRACLKPKLRYRDFPSASTKSLLPLCRECSSINRRAKAKGLVITPEMYQGLAPLPPGIWRTKDELPPKSKGKRGRKPLTLEEKLAKAKAAVYEIEAELGLARKV